MTATTLHLPTRSRVVHGYLRTSILSRLEHIGFYLACFLLYVASNYAVYRLVISLIPEGLSQ